MISQLLADHLSGSQLSAQSASTDLAASSCPWTIDVAAHRLRHHWHRRRTSKHDAV